MNVRQAKLDEAEIIVDFQLLMAHETEGIILDKGVILEGIKAVFENDEKGSYYVATDQADQVIGCLLTTYEWSEWRNGTVLWIQSVYVKKEHRGQGVYKMLYDHIRQKVKADKGLVGIRLYVEKENSNAQRVYEKLGMNGDHYKLYEWLK